MKLRRGQDTTYFYLVLLVESFLINLFKHLFYYVLYLNWRENSFLLVTIKSIQRSSTSMSLCYKLMLILGWSLGKILITSVLFEVVGLAIWSTQEVFTILQLICIDISLKVMVRFNSRVKWRIKHIFLVVTT